MLRSQPYTTALEKRCLRKRAYKSLIETSCSNRILGGYCGGVPPLPIPNREVKPTSADGTAMQCGRVGNRLLLQESSETKVSGLSFCKSHSPYTIAVSNAHLFCRPIWGRLNASFSCANWRHLAMLCTSFSYTKCVIYPFFVLWVS